MKKWYWFVLLLLLIGFQYRLWVGEGSLAELWQIKGKIEEQESVNAELQERNEKLKAEVVDLKQGLGAIEERARTDLGMIRESETFYQLAEPTTQDSQSDN